MLRILTKEGDNLNILVAPNEHVKIGETFAVSDIVAQVIDIKFADVPGVLEHILRKSLIPDTKANIPPAVRSVLDSLADHKLAVAKIRGRIQKSGNKGRFKSGFVEFEVSRSTAKVRKIPQDELFSILELTDVKGDWSNTIAEKPRSFAVLPERFGINLVTGVKESGKSYAAKKLLFSLIDRKVVNIVFDLNAEYVNLWRTEKGRPNRYAKNFRIFKPYIVQPSLPVVPFRIPLAEIGPEQFGKLMNIGQDQAMFLNILQFWKNMQEQHNTTFGLAELRAHVQATVTNDKQIVALTMRIDAAEQSHLFGLNDFTQVVSGWVGQGGVAVLDLSAVAEWSRRIIVSYVLGKLKDITANTQSLSIFLEEAHLYVEADDITDIVTRMRHYGVYPTFITNVPKNIPEVVFTLLDNLIAFKVQDQENLNQLSSSGRIDSDTIKTIAYLEQGQCLVVGRATNNYPIFVHVTPAKDVRMGGETRPLV